MYIYIHLQFFLLFCVIERKARNKAADLYGEEVIDSGGVQFFRMFEQIYQCSKYDLHKIILNLVEFCLKVKCLEPIQSLRI